MIMISTNIQNMTLENLFSELIEIPHCCSIIHNNQIFNVFSKVQNFRGKQNLLDDNIGLKKTNCRQNKTGRT